MVIPFLLERPVYAIPGEQDYASCPNPDQAFQYWLNEIGKWDASTKYVVKRQKGRIENFAFVFRKVLYIGVHVVGTEDDLYNKEEWSYRLSDDLQWVKENVQANLDRIKGIIIFGHKYKQHEVNQEFFFTPLAESIRGWEKETAYIYLTNAKMDVQKGVLGIPNFSIARVEASIWPPMQVMVDTSTSRMELLFEQKKWFKW